MPPDEEWLPDPRPVKPTWSMMTVLGWLLFFFAVIVTSLAIAVLF